MHKHTTCGCAHECTHTHTQLKVMKRRFLGTKAHPVRSPQKGILRQSSEVHLSAVCCLLSAGLWDRMLIISFIYYIYQQPEGLAFSGLQWPHDYSHSWPTGGWMVSAAGEEEDRELFCSWNQQALSCPHFEIFKKKKNWHFPTWNRSI